MIVEVGEIKESSSDVAGGLSTWECKISARWLKRIRRSCWKVVSECQLLGRNSASFSSCSSVKNMIALCEVWSVVAII